MMEEAAQAVAQVFIDTIIDHAKRHVWDTGRYAHAWAEAGAAAGLRVPSLPEIKPSASTEEFIGALNKQVEYWEKQLAYWQRWADRYQRQQATLGAIPTQSGKPRKKRTRQPFYTKKIMPELRAAQKNLEKSIERRNTAVEFTAGGGVVAFFDEGRFSQQNSYRRNASAYGKRGVSSTKRGAKGRRRLSSIRIGTQGGWAEVTVEEDRVVYMFHNREPHAKIVESLPRFKHPRRVALTRANMMASEKARQVLVKELAAISGRV
jgi:hypothetical protein